MTVRFLADDVENDFVESLRGVLDAHCRPEVVRSSWDSSDQLPGGLWEKLSETGLFGAAVPVDAGGAGLGLDSLVLALEATGAAGAPGPIAETCAVTGPILARSGEEELLGQLLGGRSIVAVQFDPDPYIANLDACDHVLIQRGGELLLGARDAVEAVRVGSIDGSRPLHRVESIAGLDALRLDARDQAAAFDAGCIAVAALLVGLADAVVERAVSYTRDRQQFGRPVGSFQAVQHSLADAYVQVELARRLVHNAAASHAGNGDGSLQLSGPCLASMTKTSAIRAASSAAEASLQAHGAMGYSFEYDLHLFLKRIWSLRPSWGELAWHRARVAGELGAASASLDV